MEPGIIAAKLLAYVIDGVDPKFEKGISIDHGALFKFAKSHSVDNVVGMALEKLNMMPPQYEQAYTNARKISVVREATQEIETQELCGELERLGIKYMLLKGSVMKHLYPTPDLRSMCDVDILYDTAFADKLTPLMEELGYELYEATGTDNVNLSYLKKPFMNIEFHGVLMDRDVPLYNAYFGENFEHTMPDEGCAVKYPDEDFFVFMVAHLAKHYFNGGTGLRSLADIWLYLRKKSELDMAKIKSKLRQIELDEFTDIIIGVNGVLFDGNQPTAQQSEVINYIFHSGTYGTIDQKAENNMQGRSKGGFLLHRLFPGRDFMAINYPAVGKCALLLPLFWLVRLVKVLVKKDYKDSDVSMVMNLSASQLDARKIPGKPLVDYNYNNRKEDE